MAFRCGHEQTRENTTVQGKCRHCFNAYHAQYAKKVRDAESPEVRHLRYRVNYLPKQLAAAKLRVQHLEREAMRLGLSDLVAQERAI